MSRRLLRALLSPLLLLLIGPSGCQCAVLQRLVVDMTISYVPVAPGSANAFSTNYTATPIYVALTRTAFEAAIASISATYFTAAPEFLSFLVYNATEKTNPNDGISKIMDINVQANVRVSSDPAISPLSAASILQAVGTNFVTGSAPYRAALAQSIPSVFTGVAVVALNFWGAGAYIEFVEPPTSAPPVQPPTPAPLPPTKAPVPPPTKAPVATKCKAAQKKCTLGSECCSGNCKNKKCA